VIHFSVSSDPGQWYPPLGAAGQAAGNGARRTARSVRNLLTTGYGLREFGQADKTLAGLSGQGLAVEG
jgi:hypothetical protein